MAAPILSTMSPVKINTTVLAVESLSIDEGLQESQFRHSGNAYASNMVRGPFRPQITFRTPWAAAIALIGLNGLAVTTLEAYEATFTDYEREATGTKFDLATDAKALVTINGFSEGDGGIIMADVAVLILSDDGTTNPIESTDAQALPSLASEPTLHIRGPVALDGTRINGVESITGSINHNINAPISDGDLYPRSAAITSSDYTISIGHGAPLEVLSALGLEGAVPSTAVEIFLREVGSDYLTRGSNGYAIATATGLARPNPIGQSVGSVSRSGIDIISLSADGAAEPWALTASKAVPAA